MSCAPELRTMSVLLNPVHVIPRHLGLGSFTAPLPTRFAGSSALRCSCLLERNPTPRPCIATRSAITRRLCAWAAMRVQGTVPRHLPYLGAFVGIASLTLDSGNDVDYVYGTGCKRNRQRFQHESFQDVDVPGPRSDEDDVARSTSRLNRDDLACRQGAHAGVLPQHWLPTGCCDRPTRPRVESCVARRRNHISWTPCRRRTWECAQSRGSRR